MISVVIPFRADTKEDVNLLIIAIESVFKQDYEDWEIILADDHSTANLTSLHLFLYESDYKDKVRGIKVRGEHKVVSARNEAVQAAQGEWILPLDADDTLPEKALSTYMEHVALVEDPEKKIFYGDILIFGEDFQRDYHAGRYDYKRLLERTFLSVSCLHHKTAWEAVGGWKKEFADGLEDWEYWIALGAKGYCGHYIKERLYNYYKKPDGRLHAIKETGKFGELQGKIRDIHSETYQGRNEMACGGCRKSTPRQDSVDRTDILSSTQPINDDTVSIVYTGNRQGTFMVTGQSTGTRYLVRGPGKTLIRVNGGFEGVFRNDVGRILRMGGGHDFRVA